MIILNHKDLVKHLLVGTKIKVNLFLTENPIYIFQRTALHLQWVGERKEKIQKGTAKEKKDTATRHNASED